MNKENFLKTAKIIITLWLLFLAIDTAGIIYNASQLTEQSGSYQYYLDAFMSQVAEGNRELSDLLTIGQYSANQIYGRTLIAIVRLLVLLPWWFSYKTIRDNKPNRNSFLVLMFISSLVIGFNWTTLANFPMEDTEGMQTWYTYLSTALNYPISLLTFAWAFMWLNSKVRHVLITPAKTIVEEKKKFQAM